MFVVLALTQIDLFWWLIAIGAGLLVLALATVLFLKGLTRYAPNIVEGSFRSVTTFMAVLVGIIVLTIMFLVLVQETGNSRTFDNAMKAAALIIAPLGTFIGFVAGQSAGSASAEKATEIATEAQHMGKQANEAAVELIRKLEAANAREAILRGKMEPSVVDSVTRENPRAFNLSGN